MKGMEKPTTLIDILKNAQNKGYTTISQLLFALGSEQRDFKNCQRTFLTDDSHGKTIVCYLKFDCDKCERFFPIRQELFLKEPYQKPSVLNHCPHYPCFLCAGNGDDNING